MTHPTTHQARARCGHNRAVLALCSALLLSVQVPANSTLSELRWRTSNAAGSRALTAQWVAGGAAGSSRVLLQGLAQGSQQLLVHAPDGRARQSLARGFADVISSLKIDKTNATDVLAAETVTMLKERISKQDGQPRWTAGWGGSGGAIPQLLVADNDPGLLDGLMADAAFPDVWGMAQLVTDCRLLNRNFLSHPGSSAAQRQAFEGFTRNTCAARDAGNGDVIVATGGSGNAGCGLNDNTKVDHPTLNPTGARCTIRDVSANSLGKDSNTGFARRPLDNVEVQYGLGALKAGAITVAQFLAVNQGVGGYDANGNLISRRTAADLACLAALFSRRGCRQQGQRGAGAAQGHLAALLRLFAGC